MWFSVFDLYEYQLILLEPWWIPKLNGWWDFPIVKFRSLELIASRRSPVRSSIKSAVKASIGQMAAAAEKFT